MHGRGSGALGYTLYRPEEDRLLHTRTALCSAISSLLAGSLAEELALGEASDGCSSDLKRGTQIASRMVVEFGMSPVVGRLNYVGGSGLASPDGTDRKWSEQTVREIDLEVRRIIEEAQARARRVLEERRSELDRIATRLIDQETIDAAELERLLSSD
ncbi:MAG: hypothetical protein ACP5XB_15245 [Isosphaeraceae bacterium]